MVDTLRRRSGKRSSHQWAWQVVEGAVVGKNDISGMESSIILGISSNIYLMDNKEVTSLESNDYMVITGKGLTTYLSLSTQTSNNS